jgi:hypothetical protein
MDTELIQPCIASEAYRPQAVASKREADASTFHQKVLGRAANCVRSNPNILIWMFLSSKNVDDFVLLDERHTHVLKDGTSYREVTTLVARVVNENARLTL